MGLEALSFNFHRASCLRPKYKITALFIYKAFFLFRLGMERTCDTLKLLSSTMTGQVWGLVLWVEGVQVLL